MPLTIMDNQPAIEAILKAHEAGQSDHQIATALGHHLHTVRKVTSSSLAFDSEAREEWAQQQATRYQDLTTKALAKYEKALQEDKINVNQLPVHSAIFIDKRAILLQSNSPTSQGHADTPAIHDVLAELRALRKQPTVAVQVNVTGDCKVDCKETKQPTDD